MSPRTSLIDWLWLLVVGSATSVACILAAQQVGVTFDEPTYLEHGLNFWHTGSHHPLMKLGTMPLPVDTQTLPIALTEWLRGERYSLVNDFQTIIVWMRYGNLLFWWMLLYFGMQFARELGGIWAGRIAVTALGCEPNLLAHAALATTDIAITASLLGFSVAFLRGRELAWRGRVLWPGIWCGVALLSKASALAFCPILMLAVEFVRRQKCECGPVREHCKSFVRDGIHIGLIGFAIAIIGCGSDFQPSPWFVKWSHQLPEGRDRTIYVWLAEHLCIFGNAIEAFANQVQHNMRGHGQFLMGESSNKPFLLYFPVLFLLKLTLPVLLLTGFVVLTGYRHISRNSALVAFGLLLVFSLNCRVQLGIRMQLLAVALLLIGLAVHVVQHWPDGRWQIIAAHSVTAVGLMAMACDCMVVFPNGLTYFNRLWGDPLRTYLLASDSNYDWGQGLHELDQWHRDCGRPGLDVWYFGQDPLLKSMAVRDLPLHCLPLTGPADFPQYLWGRKLAVGTSIIHGAPLTPAHRVALEFLKQRQPIDRTRTFIVYDFSDLTPPQTASAGGDS